MACIIVEVFRQLNMNMIVVCTYYRWFGKAKCWYSIGIRKECQFYFQFVQFDLSGSESLS